MKYTEKNKKNEKRWKKDIKPDLIEFDVVMYWEYETEHTVLAKNHEEAMKKANRIANNLKKHTKHHQPRLDQIEVGKVNERST